jgi:hypothetical protein
MEQSVCDDLGMDEDLAIIRSSGGGRELRRAAWERVLERWRASGMGIVAFAAQHGMSCKHLYRWRAKLARAGASDDIAALPAAPGFVELGIAPAGGAAAALEVHLGDARVVVGGVCDAALLRMVLGVLREGAC